MKQICVMVCTYVYVQDSKMIHDCRPNSWMDFEVVAAYYQFDSEISITGMIIGWMTKRHPIN